MSLDNVVLNASKASVNYAKARFAIEQEFPFRKDKRLAKLTVIEHLNGHKIADKVEFDDGSSAKY